MATKRQALSDLFKTRLSRRIVFWVFASIVLIEGIILIPSVYRRERELLIYQQELAAAKASGLLAQTALPQTEAALLTRLRTTQDDTAVGGALYRAEGTLVGTFGEAPALTFADVAAGQETLLNRAQHRYDAVWQMSPLDGQYLLIIRHDTTLVRQEVIAFIGRITGLVVIISFFVTGATMIVLERLLITPILRLRRDLLKTGRAISADQDARLVAFESAKTYRQDELGDVVTAFEQMLQQISEAIANRKQAEAELRLSEEKFSKAFRSSPNPITMSTMINGKLIEANDSFLRLHGSSLEQVIGQTALDLKLWANPRDRQQMIQTIRDRGYIRNREYCFLTRTQERRTVLYSAEQISINQQDCILSVVSDITERKQAEEALRASEQRFRMLVEQAVDAIFVVNEQGGFVDANQQACHSLGYSRAELMQLSVTDIQQDLTAEQFSQLWQSLTVGSPATVEGTHRRQDGSQFPVEVRLGLLEFGSDRLILALARDTSERKQAEAALARLAEIGELAAMIVHEVRNPLTTVLMGLSSFKRLDLPERAQMRLSFALEESERLQRLLNEILLYAKQQNLALSELDLKGLLAEMLESLQAMPAASDRQIQFSVPEQPAPILGDTDKLKQVFINLIGNACEAIAGGEQVFCRLEIDQPQQRAVVEVHNGGEPIPPEVLPKLTQPFFTTKSSGNGLGLAITKRIIEAHGGELAIASAAATGTTVTVTLPLKPT
ncbi:PAS domain S-box protein [Sphaerothrix gracilis]|uniref:PAS domain S-box protein n=1 Tax=Sphaerothrix gracilis TaxID=3151835 RepID=UPI0031FC25AF